MITAVIITHNEESVIERCVRSLTCCEEVIIVDAESDDLTCQRALDARPDIKCITKSWSGYGAARNHGASVASHDWILSIDADEALDKELARGIEQAFKDENAIYLMKRVNIYRGRKMRYGMLHPEQKPRLYHRHQSQWDDRSVHESLQYAGPVRLESLAGTLYHHTHDDADAHRSKLKYYASLDVREPSAKSSWTRTLAPYYHFIRTYILQLGFLEGRLGWETSVTAFIYSREKAKAIKLIG